MWGGVLFKIEGIEGRNGILHKDDTDFAGAGDSKKKTLRVLKTLRVWYEMGTGAGLRPAPTMSPDEEHTKSPQRPYAGPKRTLQVPRRV